MPVVRVSWIVVISRVGFFRVPTARIAPTPAGLRKVPRDYHVR